MWGGFALIACLQVLGRDELYVPENQARARLEIALDNTRRVYAAAYHRLNLLFPDDPALVESFFSSFYGDGGKAPRATTGASTPADAPVVPTPTAGETTDPSG